MFHSLSGFLNSSNSYLLKAFERMNGLSVLCSMGFLSAELPFRAQDSGVQPTQEQDRCRHGYRQVEVRMRCNFFSMTIQFVK